MQGSFSLNGLMVLESACWRKTPTVANPPLSNTLSDQAKMVLALRISDAIARSQLAHAAGEDNKTDLVLEEEETWHLIQGVDIFARAGREEVGLGILNVLYELLRAKEREKVAEGLQKSIQVGDAEVEEETYETRARDPGRGPNPDQPVGDAQGGPNAPVQP